MKLDFTKRLKYLFPTFRRLMPLKVQLGAFWPRRTNRTQRKSLLRMIAVATEESLPILPLLEAWTWDERGTYRSKLWSLCATLRGGAALPEAVERVPGLLDDEELLAVRFGSQSGMLGTTLRDSLCADDLISWKARENVRKSVVYLGLLTLIAVPAVTFLHIKIISNVERVWDEFDLNYSEALAYSICLANFAVAYWWVWALLLIGLFACLVLRGPGRFVRRSLVSRVIRPLSTWRIGSVLRWISVAAAQGRPLAGAISTLARYHYDPAIRQRLLVVRNEMEMGYDVWRALREVGFLSSAELAAIDASERVGNRDWVLRQIADHKKRLANRKLENLSSPLLPALVLIVAAFVLLQAVGVFGSLAQLIEALA